MERAKERERQPMQEAELIAAIDDADNRSYGSNLSNLTAALSAERALNIDLYLGKNVDPAPEGQSNVIDRTVFETVQWILPSLCRIFANGDDVVTLSPLGPQDVDQAKQESAYLNWLVTVKHSWFDLFLEWATDALLTKNAYFLVYQDNAQKVEIENYKAQTRQGVAFLTMDKDVEVIDIQPYAAPDLQPEPIVGPDGQPTVDANGQPMTQPAQLYDIQLRRRQIDAEVCIRVLPPERVKIDQRAFSWKIDDRCNYFEYWEETTLSELREQGFDIPTDIADDPEIYTQEDYARDQYGERRLDRYKPSDPSMRRVKARMIWIRTDYNGDGKSELLQVLRVGRRLLYTEEVSRIPVASGVACPVPHRHIGISIADMVSDIQRIKTAILRQGLDNLYISNNPQKVLNEQFVNIDDALISRPGGVIRATDINQIRYEEMPFVFPQAVEGLKYMDEVRQNRTGVNNNFSGIGTQDISNLQPGTVSQLSGLAAQRVEQIARILAFAIEDLFSIVHEQTLKLGHKRQVVQLNGQWAEVDPGAWRRRTDFKVCVAFSAGNKDSQVARLMAIANQQKEALTLGIPVCNAENYYNTLAELTKAADFAAPERFWTDPKSMPPQPPKPDPKIVVAEMQNASHEKQKAADLMQQEVESQRKAAMEKYAIDSNVGVNLIKEQHSAEHALAMQNLKTQHTAIIDSLKGQMSQAEGAAGSISGAVQAAHGAITAHTGKVTEAMQQMGTIGSAINKAVVIATGKRVVRKHPKTGIPQGIDIIGHDGKVAHSQNFTHDANGRISGVE
jgi:hypothetical protein